MDSRNNIAAWEVFLSLARTGNVTQTAIELDRSGSDVSKLIRSLEDDLGFALFDRSHRPFPPTPRALELASSISPLITGLKNAIRAGTSERRTILLRVSAPSDLATDFIPEQLMLYGDRHSHIRMELSQLTDIEAVLDGSVDVALLQRPSNAAGLLIRPCITCSCCPLASPEYLAEHGTPKSIVDLREHTGLLGRWNKRPPTSFLYNREGQPSELIHWKRVFVTDNQLSLRSLALRHRGITLDLASSNAIEELEKGLLVPVLPQWRRENWELCVVTRQDRENANPELRLFAEWWAAKESQDSMSRIVRGDQLVQRCLENPGGI